MTFWILQSFNGISYGVLLFLLAACLSLIVGVMRILNLAHGSYFLFGADVALSTIRLTGSWALSLPAGALAAALLGAPQVKANPLVREIYLGTE